MKKWSILYCSVSQTVKIAGVGFTICDDGQYRIPLFLIVRAGAGNDHFHRWFRCGWLDWPAACRARQSLHLRGGLGAGTQLGLPLAGGLTQALVMGEQLFGRELFGLLVDAGLGTVLGFHAFVFFKFHR